MIAIRNFASSIEQKIVRNLLRDHGGVAKLSETSIFRYTRQASFSHDRMRSRGFTKRPHSAGLTLPRGRARNDVVAACRLPANGVGRQFQDLRDTDWLEPTEAGG